MSNPVWVGVDFVPTSDQIRHADFGTNASGWRVLAICVERNESLDQDQVTQAVVSYERYNGSSSHLGLFSNVVEVVDASRVWESRPPEWKRLI